MYKVPCACGQDTMMFFNKIGPFYVGPCCVDKGYDHLGNPPKVVVTQTIVESEFTVERTPETHVQTKKERKSKKSE